MKLDEKKTTLIHAAAVVVALFTPLAATSAEEKLTAAEAKEIAKEAFLWGMHPVAIYHLRYNLTQNEKSPINVGINRLRWDRTPMKAMPRNATTPNATTLYGVAILDLSKEPVVITVPEIEDHYWSIQFHDNYARWWHMIGSQFNAPGPVRRLLIGPNWSGDLPDGFVGADIVRAPSDFAGALARVALTDDTAEELKIVNGIQDRITVMSLSAWLAVLAMSAEGVGVERNGWDFSSDLEYKDTDWRQRARYGLIAVLAPVPSRSHLGTFCMKDSEGPKLSGEHRYTITFDLNNMPPVTEFWEMPLYDTESYFYDNPIGRYSLNSYMLERGKLHTEDDKLVIYVQHDEPTDPKQRQNWLPAPKDGFQFTARFYGPATSLINDNYDMPGVPRVD